MYSRASAHFSCPWMRACIRSTTSCSIVFSSVRSSRRGDEPLPMRTAGSRSSSFLDFVHQRDHAVLSITSGTNASRTCLRVASRPWERRKMWKTFAALVLISSSSSSRRKYL